MKISTRQQEILEIIMKKGALQSSNIYKDMIDNGKDISLVSIKRDIAEMVKAGTLAAFGAGRYINYNISTAGRVISEVNAKSYTAIEPDKRFGLDSYNFNLFSEFPSAIFDVKQLNLLSSATKEYKKRTQSISNVIAEKELQRLIIELSWKSSRIEGNTYTLLDTEKLILEQKEAPGHDKGEAQMILNHKDAFNFIRENEVEYKSLTIANLEKLHSILVKDLGVKAGLRNSLVGVTGSKYKPLDNKYQIREAVEELACSISEAKDPYTKAMLALLGISYVQPFEDGNKRTGRLMANAILLAYGCAPLSYRSVDEVDYRNSVLVFYEINSVIAFQKIFIEQYLFAAKNYAVK